MRFWELGFLHPLAVFRPALFSAILTKNMVFQLELFKKILRDVLEVEEFKHLEMKLK